MPASLFSRQVAWEDQLAMCVQRQHLFAPIATAFPTS